MNEQLHIGIVTISDRASHGEYEDLGGPALKAWLEQAISSPWQAVCRLVPDEQALIAAALRELCDNEGCALVITTGGTGPAPRDVTPEATREVCDKILDGFGERMRATTVEAVPTAILSRQLAGVRGHSLIINLPGRPTAIAECLRAVFAAVPGCIRMLGGPLIETSAELP